MYRVCMYVILDATDAYQLSQNDMQYKAAKPKPILLDKAINNG